MTTHDCLCVCYLRLKTQGLMSQLQKLSADLGTAAKAIPSHLQRCQKLMADLKDVLHELEE